MKGVVLLTLSAAFFALSTVCARILFQISDIPVTQITFVRFAFGFILVALYLALRKETFRPNNKRYVYLRALFNTIAVILFFWSLKFTTVAHANLLNMTYPVFVVALGPFLNQERNNRLIYLFLVTTMAGIAVVILPGGDLTAGINRGDILALASGLVAAFAISTLRQARKFDNSATILFYLMAGGTILNGLFFPFFIMPDFEAAMLLFASAFLGVTGQFFITEGFRSVKAAAGSIISATRIPFAILMGFLFLNEQVTLITLFGSLLIFISLAGISAMKAEKAS